MSPMISLIAAVARNRVIGRENRLPWHLPEDLARFKRLTLGKCVIMGRKTYESIGKPLPGRTTIVVTRQEALAFPPGVIVARSPAEALERAHGEEVMVAGGAEIYAQTLARADRLYLTMVESDLEGDRFFPEIDDAQWTVTERAEGGGGAGAAKGRGASPPVSYAFVQLDRTRGA